jgi:hypothetical protein
MGNAQFTAKRPEGVSPQPLWLPDAIPPGQVLRHHRTAQERDGGQVHVPSFLRTCILNFISMEKEFQRACFLKICIYSPDFFPE